MNSEHLLQYDAGSCSGMVIRDAETCGDTGSNPVDPAPLKIYWRDIDVETLSREELLVALSDCYKSYR